MKTEASNLEALERAKDSYKKALEKDSVFKDLSPKEQELRLNISIIKALEALDKKDKIISKINPLEAIINSKQLELDSKQDGIDSAKNNQSTVSNKVSDLQKSSFSIGTNIASSEGNIRNLEKIEAQSAIDLEKTKDNYARAVEKEANNDHLSPKEKAIHLLDSITELLKSFGSNADLINRKILELKELLMNLSLIHI